MPKSKRNQVVSLTKVKKKGREGKEDLVSKIQEGLTEYKFQYVLSFQNIRAGPFKALAKKMREHSKFFLGKNKVIQVALGKTPEDEVADNSHLLSKYMHGQVCLLLSNKQPKELEEIFKEEEVDDFAQAGTAAAYTVFLQKGTEALDGYAHSIEPYLQKLGLPTKLNFQKIELTSDVYVCREGQTLNVEQCKILKLLGHKMASFKLDILCQRAGKGKFKEFEAGRVFLLNSQDA